MNTKDKGHLSEAKILAHFLERGWRVSIPWGENSPYDMVVEIGGRLLRVQCKTARKPSRYPNSYSFKTCSTYYIKGKATDVPYKEIDAFAVYIPHTEQICLIPIDECKNKAAMQFAPDRMSKYIV